MRLLDGVANPRLRRQVQHLGRAHPRKQRGQRLPVGDVQALEAEMGMRPQARQAGLFQGGVVVGVEVVDADHGIAARQQAFAGVHSDKSGSAGNKHRVHGEGRGFWGTGGGAARGACAGCQRNW